MSSLCMVRTVSIAIVGIALLVGGCSADPDKASLFDHHHDTPAHWPDNLGDTADKIRERLVRLKDDEQTTSDELTDLVAWAPEIAADTSLSESKWNPIFEASEELRARLEGNEGKWDSDARQRAEKLCALVDDVWLELPEEERSRVRHHGHHHHHAHGDHDHAHGDHDHAHGDHDKDHDDENQDSDHGVAS